MKTAAAIRVLIVEDHFLARHGIRGLIDDQDDMSVAGEAKTGEEALGLFEKVLPDIVLMDLALPGQDGIATTLSLCDRHAGARVLVVSNSDGSELIARALDAGALGYLRKDVEGEVLVEAIRTIVRGPSEVPYLSPEIARRLQQARGEGRLGKRETELLELIALGRSNQEIATIMSLTHGTVRIYVSRILAKLGASSRTEAVSMAIERGLLGPRR